MAAVTHNLRARSPLDCSQPGEHERRWAEGEGWPVSYARFGCTAHASRGSAICASALPLSAKKASQALVSALREKLGCPELVERFITSFEQRVALRRKEDAAPNRANDRVADCERCLANLTEALAKAGGAEALAAKLRSQRRRARSQSSARFALPGPRKSPGGRFLVGHAVTTRHHRASQRSAHDGRLTGTRSQATWTKLFAVLETEAARGRERLARFVSPSP